MRIKLRNKRRTDVARLEATVELCRELYNAALEERVEAWRRQHRSITYAEQCRSLTQILAQDERYAVLAAQMTQRTVLRGGQKVAVPIPDELPTAVA